MREPVQSVRKLVVLLFATDPAMKLEPTNNAAERALRHAVIWKRISFGSQSASCSRVVLRYLHDSLTTKLNHIAAPSLLPNGA